MTFIIANRKHIAETSHFLLMIVTFKFRSFFRIVENFLQVSYYTIARAEFPTGFNLLYQLDTVTWQSTWPWHVLGSHA